MPTKPAGDVKVLQPTLVKMDDPDTKWVQITGGNYMCLGIDNAGGDAVPGCGNLWSWGSNQFGQLGRDDEGELGGQFDSWVVPVSTKPGKVTHPDGRLWRDVSVLPGTAHVLAIDEDGHMWAWGEGWDGQIGNGIDGEHGDDVASKPGTGTFYKKPVPVIVPGYENAIWRSVSTAYGIEGHAATPGGVSMAVMEDDGVNGELNGSLWAWGDNRTGLLGIGTSGNMVGTPTQVQRPGR
jgi:alpha-tubulin suppressor-like RCC1 family protein